MIGFVGTSLQLHSIITAHTLNDVCPTDFYEESTPFYNCHAVPQRSHHGEQLILHCFSVYSWECLC
jgi:hypothetical protein